MPHRARLSRLRLNTPHGLGYLGYASIRRATPTLCTCGAYATAATLCDDLRPSHTLRWAGYFGGYAWPQYAPPLGLRLPLLNLATTRIA